MLNNDPKSAKVNVGYMGNSKVGTRISRVDVTDFMLKHVEHMEYLRQAPAISS
jgi:hypothetical protein